MDTRRYAELFRAEARERLSEMNTALLALEQGDGADRISELFRAVHSVKGMSAAMGYESVRDLSHALEALLARLRAESISPTPAVIEVLFRSLDALEAAIVAVSRDPDANPDTASAIVLLEALSPQAELDSSVLATMEWPALKPREAAAPPRKTASRPARSVRIDTKRLDSLMTLVGELVIARGRLGEDARRINDPALLDSVTAAAQLISSLQEEITTSRMVPVGQAFERFDRMVRDTSRELGKRVEFVLGGMDIEVDKSVLDEIGDPVLHLLRNAIDHGIESPAEREAAGKPAVATLSLTGERDGSSVLIQVRDDGRGIDLSEVARRIERTPAGAENLELTGQQILEVIAQPGFSTADKVSRISGRGVGLDVVATRVRSLGGSLSLETEPGAGTTVGMRLPVTLAIVHALLARAGDDTYALPIGHVVETLVLEEGMSSLTGAVETVSVRGEQLPAVRLRERLGYPPRAIAAAHVVVLEFPEGRSTLIVDALTGQQEIVVKPFDAARGMPQLFSGATILSNGRPALILDARAVA